MSFLIKPRKCLKKYYKKHFDVIVDLIKKSDTLNSKEDIHKLRVEIKKVRALVSLLDGSMQNFNTAKILSPIEEIFDKAGKIRAIQLEAAWIGKHDPGHHLDTLKRSLHQDELKARRNFADICKELKKDFIRSLEQIALTIQNIDKRKLESYLKLSHEKLASLIEQNKLETSQVHTLRKQLKRFHYNIKSLCLNDGSKSVKDRDALQEIMGQWHDSRVMNKDLVKRAGNHSSNFVAESILQLAGKLYTKSEILYRQINKKKLKIV